MPASGSANASCVVVAVTAGFESGAACAEGDIDGAELLDPHRDGEGAVGVSERGAVRVRRITFCPSQRAVTSVRVQLRSPPVVTACPGDVQPAVRSMGRDLLRRRRRRRHDRTDSSTTPKSSPSPATPPHPRAARTAGRRPHHQRLTRLWLMSAATWEGRTHAATPRTFRAGPAGSGSTSHRCAPDVRSGTTPRGAVRASVASFGPRLPK